MALDTRTRSSIYRKLTPILGEDDANALMSQFPGSEGDELVTKSFLRAEMSSLETRLTLRIGAMGVVILSAMFGLKVFA